MINIEALNPRFITDERGNKESVILPLESFEELMEDLQDLAVVAERKEEPTIAHADFMEELKNSGLL
uniref:Antitoxin Phd_YefM, type II toxin-antitoxin system n=1 Tax=Candidatus Kentrum eta TaxID=2126337 RepID=A0A450UNL6_9GAMM|nr:MAG: hypothetical protein BECKH772A_GA0070896_1006616 [Candidatus Kentron sp. H]VFJ95468.1 MAG: hypothetical protein BECKH772B_GA0070898_1007615 [Candidatus Kentron sp. H]VFK01546.1 MAG: hypothetical protein BECKH772C_GA0070978_1006816 [Candidatus Kentron sp. H]